MTIAERTRTRDARTYAGATANMQVDPAAYLFEGAVESFQDQLSTAACGQRLDLEWVPDQEDQVLPAEQAETCAGCPLRQACLVWATMAGVEGYWAGTTTQDRRTLWRAGDLGVSAADARRREQLEEIAAAARADAASALHDPGEGSLWWYRHGGCRCTQCRGENAANRARERARAAA